MSEMFMNAMATSTNTALTENGGVAFATTKSSMLDFFAMGGALRHRDDKEVVSMLSMAMSEDKLNAIRAMFYFRDARGGQGERDTFRKQLKWLAVTHPEIVKANIDLIADYGRWDDLYTLFDTPLEKYAIDVFARQLARDMHTERPSLLVKWLKSENTSSKESVRLARSTRKGLGMTPQVYRKVLSGLRKQINIVERLISSNQWSEVNYSAVPSQANMKYKTAFYKHDTERRLQFIESVKQGEAKINASTLYPYEIVRDAQKLEWDTEAHAKDVTNALWAALPDYIGDANVNALAVVDVSGSMTGLPMQVSISLGMYLAEHNKSEAYRNKFITFSSRPDLVTIKGDTFVERVHNMSRAAWEMNTDIVKVFDLILDVAVKNKLTQGEIPSKLFIISDMCFDDASNSEVDEKIFEMIARKFSEAGYQLPFLVFWDVNSVNTQVPMSMDQRGFQLVSGCSPSIFTNVLKGTTLSAYDLMLEVLGAERYQQIKLS